jgi:hypothetical protein
MNYDLPNTMRIHISHLKNLALYWLELNHPIPNSDVNNLCDQIQKYIVLLIEEISNHKISLQLIYTFSEIVIDYIDIIVDNEAKINDLADIFNKMTLSNGISNTFINDFSQIRI